jgi:hypothetical protein
MHYELVTFKKNRIAIFHSTLALQSQKSDDYSPIITASSRRNLAATYLLIGRQDGFPHPQSQKKNRPGQSKDELRSAAIGVQSELRSFIGCQL